jgi:hypothetical protein
MFGYTSQGHIKSVIAAIFGFIGNESIANGSSKNKFFRIHITTVSPTVSNSSIFGRDVHQNTVFGAHGF